MAMAESAATAPASGPEGGPKAARREKTPAVVTGTLDFDAPGPVPAPPVAPDPAPAAFSGDSTLSEAENTELRALQKLIDAQKLKPGSDGWDRWKELLEIKHGTRREPAKPAAGAVAPDPAPKRDLKWWAAFYFPGKSPAAQVKHIDRMRRDGRRGGLLPPLERPAEMPGWFTAMMAKGFYPRGCPEEILDAARREAAPAAAGAEPVRHEIDLATVSDAEKDPAEVLRRLEDDEVRLRREYDAARGRGDVADVQRRRWTEATERVAAQRAQMAKMGELVPVATATDAYRRIIHPLPGILERLLVKNPPLPGEKWPETVKRAVRSAFASVPGELRELLTA